MPTIPVRAHPRAGTRGVRKHLRHIDVTSRIAELSPRSADQMANELYEFTLQRMPDNKTEALLAEIADIASIHAGNPRGKALAREQPAWLYEAD
jgi:hypothetical protein